MLFHRSKDCVCLRNYMDVAAIHIDSNNKQFHSSTSNRIAAGTPEIQATTIFDFRPKVDGVILPDPLNYNILRNKEIAVILLCGMAHITNVTGSTPGWPCSSIPLEINIYSIPTHISSGHSIINLYSFQIIWRIN